MEEITRGDIHIVNRHSQWPSKELDRALTELVYNDVRAWRKFLRLFFLGLGAGFILSGIIFFFAYNWHCLHRFTKLGLLEALVIVAIFCAWLFRSSSLIKNILITAACVLTGALFAVFGQIYHTGANAYDFFLGWTVFITLWVIISDFAVLWLIYVCLLNTTLVLYFEQQVSVHAYTLSFLVQFLLNLSFLLLFMFLPAWKKNDTKPEWLLQVTAIAAIACSTAGLCAGVFQQPDLSLVLFFVLTAACYAIAIRHGLKEKKLFYLLLVPFSSVLILAAMLLKIDENAGMMLLAALFIVGSMTLLINQLMSLQKKWKNA